MHTQGVGGLTQLVTRGKRATSKSMHNGGRECTLGLLVQCVYLDGVRVGLEGVLQPVHLKFLAVAIDTVHLDHWSREKDAILGRTKREKVNAHMYVTRPRIGMNGGR